MPVRPLTRPLLAILATAIAAFSALGGVATAQARGVAQVDAAVAVGNGIPGDAAVCARQARHKVLKRAGRATVSSARPRRATAARKRRRAVAKLRKRCLIRRRETATKAPTPVGPPPAGNLVVGIDGGADDWGGEGVEERAALGAAVTRFYWDTSEAIDDHDELVLEAAEANTRIEALIGADGGNKLGDAGQYRDWVIAFVGRYGPGGSFWAEHPELNAASYAITTVELGNEPYFGEMSAPEYADTVRPTLEAIAALHLPIQVVLPSRVYGSNTSWTDTLYERIPNLNELFYAFADHPYWYGHDPAETSPAGPFDRIAKLRERMNELGASSKPIFITEYGESTADCGSECVSETVQAQHLQEMLEAVTTHTEWGVKMLDFYQLRDRGTDSSERERQFGLLREDGTPKPAYSIVQAAMQKYRG